MKCVGCNGEGDDPICWVCFKAKTKKKKKVKYVPTPELEAAKIDVKDLTRMATNMEKVGTDTTGVRHRLDQAEKLIRKYEGD